MSDDMARLRDEVAGVIGQHAPIVDTYGEPRAAGCAGGCDVEVSDQHPYRHHLADALMPLLARVHDEARCPLTEHDGTHGPLIRQAKAEALREAADEVERGARQGVATSQRRAEASDSNRSNERRRKEGHKHSAALKIADWLRTRADEVTP